MKKFFNKKNIIIISSILVVLIVVIVLFILNFNSKSKFEYYLYVKDNNLMLFNKKNDQKVTLSYNVFDDEDYSNYYGEEYYDILDNNVLVFADNIDDNYEFTLKKVNLRNVFKQQNSTVIATYVESFKAAGNTVAYISYDELFTYIEDSTSVSDEVYNYELSDDGKNVFYINDSNNLYVKDLKGNNTTKINSNVMTDYLYAVDNEIVYLKETDYEDFYDLYANEKKVIGDISDIAKIDGTLYFTRLSDTDLAYYKSNDAVTTMIELSESELLSFMDDYYDEAVLLLGNNDYSRQMFEVVSKVANENMVRVFYANIDNFSESTKNYLAEKYHDYNTVVTPYLVNVYNDHIYDELSGLASEDEVYDFFDNAVLLNNISEDELEQANNTPLLDYYVKVYQYKKGSIVEPKYKDGSLAVSEYMGDATYLVAYNLNGTNLENASEDKINLELFNNKNNKVLKLDVKLSEISYADVLQDGDFFFYSKEEGDDLVYYFYDLRNNNLDNMITAKNMCGVASIDNTFAYISDCDDTGDLRIKGSDEIIDDEVSYIVNDDKELRYLKSTGSGRFDLYALRGNQKNLLLNDANIAIEYDEEVFYYANCYTDRSDDEYCDIVYFDSLGNKKVVDTEVSVYSDLLLLKNE